MSIANQAGISEQRRVRALREALSFGEFHDAAAWNKEELQASCEAYRLSDEEIAFLDRLEEPVRAQLLAFVGRRRAEASTKELEETAILAEIRQIVGG